MPRIQEALKFARHYCARVKSVVILEATKASAAIGLKGTRKSAGDNNFEITQAVFPDKLSDAERTAPEA